MSTALQRHTAIKLSTCINYHCLKSPRSLSTDVFRVGDRVLIQLKGKDPFLSASLHPQGKVITQHGAIKHEDIIGKNSRDRVASTKAGDIRAILPSMSDYVKLTPRSVTPVYPADATVVVSLLDLHPDSLEAGRGPPDLEILEAGTGNGALTMYLARAIHAANTAVHAESSSPAEDSVFDDKGQNSNDTQHVPSSLRPSVERPEAASQPIYQHRRDHRNAVVHTIDVALAHAQLARKIVKGFRRGMYLKDIEFHIGDISEWINHQITARALCAADQTFLSHIILDMPTPEVHVEKAASVLHVNGSLLAFNPSVTQIMAVVEEVKRKYLPLQLERVLELGPNMSGGRDWDVRAVLPRARMKALRSEQEALPVTQLEEQSRGEELDDSRSVRLERRDDESSSETPKVKGFDMICRPKVGERTTGGGFVGVWKKMKW